MGREEKESAGLERSLGRWRSGVWLGSVDAVVEWWCGVARPKTEESKQG